MTIDGTRIRALIESAQTDYELRVKLFHCPEKIIASSDLSEDEARAVLTADLSDVDLDEATLAIGRRILGDAPVMEGQHPAAAQHLLFSSAAIRAMCI